MTQATEPLITAIAPWFGGKRTLAPAIVAQLGKHEQYFEPFCGGLSIIFAKEPARQETVNDLHGDLINLARILQEEEAAHELYERLVRTLVCDGLLDDAQTILNSYGLPDPENDTTGECLDRAYWYFLTCWMARNGLAGTRETDYQLAVRWTAGGGSPATRFRNAVESIPAWHQRLRNIVILNRDAFDIIPKFEDAPHTAIYVDSPYVPETRSGLSGNGSHGSQYLHDLTVARVSATGLFAAQHGDEHDRLAAILRSFRHARIVVSYYDCPRVRDLYKGWNFIEHTRQKNLHVQNGRGSRPKEAPEVLIINGESHTMSGGLFKPIQTEGEEAA